MSARTTAQRFRRPSGAGRARNRKQVREVIRLRQWWRDLDTGCVWQLGQIHRKDGVVQLRRPGVRPMFVTFGELGKRFELLDGMS